MEFRKQDLLHEIDVWLSSLESSKLYASCMQCNAIFKSVIVLYFFPNLNTFIFSVLANMLMKSGINPFDSQEAKPYKNDVEILAMTNLVNAYQNNDINDFEKILKVRVVMQMKIFQ